MQNKEFYYTYLFLFLFSMRKIIIINLFIFAAKEVSGNGRSPLLQDPLYGSRPQPYSKYAFGMICFSDRKCEI